MSLAEEIKRLGAESQTVQDQLSNSSVEFVLKHCQAAVANELESFDTVMEGLKKLGAFDAQQPPLAATKQPSSSRRGSTLLDQRT